MSSSYPSVPCACGLLMHKESERCGECVKKAAIARRTCLCGDKKHVNALTCRSCINAKRRQEGVRLRIRVGVLMCQGLNFKQIADKMGCCLNNIHIHWRGLRRMAGTDNHITFAFWMVQNGHFKLPPREPLELRKRLSLGV